MSKELLELSVLQVADLIEKKEISPVELTNTMLDYIEKSNEQTNAYISITADQARQSAQRAEQQIMDGLYKGVFHGVPLALKDNIYHGGEVTTMASKIHRDFVSEHDATVVAQLRDAGAVFTGKLNMHEYAWGIDNDSPHFGAVHNPWNPKRVPGGSSGGSGAAVAAHSSYISLGTDTAGSIRIPSAACGIVGLKPTHGRVSKFGVYPLAWTLDHVGPMAKTVADAAALMEVIAGFDPNDPTSANVPAGGYLEALSGDVKGLRIGIIEDYFFHNVDSGIEKLIRERLQDLENEGAEVVSLSLPALRYAEWAELAVSLVEAATIHHRDLVKRADDFGNDIRFLFELGELFSGIDYLQGQQVRRALKLQFAEAFDDVDVILAPVMPCQVPDIGVETVDINGQTLDFIMEGIRFTGPSNLTGLPALSVPAGMSDGMPIGLQLIGDAFDEATILNVAYAIELMNPLAGHEPVIKP